MGTDVTLVSDGAEPGTFSAAFAEVSSIFAREEARFSRFREDSELSRLNRASGRWADVSPAFAEVLRLALDGAAATGGLFDPTVLGALEAAGYDRDFGLIADRHDVRLSPRACGRWRDVELIGDRVRLPAGVGIDLGGLVKGWTADIAAGQAVALGVRSAIVSAGGDLRVAGDAGQVEIGIEEPHDRDRTCCVIRVDGGGVATSSVTLRRWGAELHHVIDPRIGLPARTPVEQATVWGPTCAAAEVDAKRALLEGIGALDDIQGVLVLASGEIVTNLAGAAA